MGALPGSSKDSGVSPGSGRQPGVRGVQTLRGRPGTTSYQLRASGPVTQPP